MIVITCNNKSSELHYLTPHAFWNISDFGAKCDKCETINTITLENGELNKQIRRKLCTNYLIYDLPYNRLLYSLRLVILHA
jgi:hypothetical protein